MQSSTEPISESSKIEARACHWCREELQGLLVEFVHCVRCNERRLNEGLDRTYDACPLCMTIKSDRSRFSKSDNDRGERNGL